MRIACFVFVLLLMAGCYDAKEQPTAKKKSKKPFVYKETIVTGKDTGMFSLSGFRKSNIADALCQRWIGGYEADLDEFSLFKDGSALVNPRTKILIGKWKVETRDEGQILMLNFDTAKAEFLIQEVQGRTLMIAGHTKQGLMVRHYQSDGLIHQNMYNDPFHPVNNRWRIPPKRPESDSAIQRRAKQCVKFYALYFRDNIKRKQKTIDFKGLPAIFEWYNRGIGLPDKTAVSYSWTECFYNLSDSRIGYDKLRTLLADYNFDWPRNAPSWVYETHSVLEQMYHKLK